MQETRNVEQDAYTPLFQSPEVASALDEKIP